MEKCLAPFKASGGQHSHRSGLQLCATNWSRRPADSSDGFVGMDNSGILSDRRRYRFDRGWTYSKLTGSRRRALQSRTNGKEVDRESILERLSSTVSLASQGVHGQIQGTHATVSHHCCANTGIVNRNMDAQPASKGNLPTIRITLDLRVTAGAQMCAPLEDAGEVDHTGIR